ncbi:MAG: hypothetical protein J6K51_06425 [Clostridia bacterium]|nr:hypothetical protein [Clostridia bacterium]
MKFIRNLFCLSWGLVLAAVGGGIIIALSVPATIIVILLSVLLIVVGYCLCMSDHKRRF